MRGLRIKAPSHPRNLAELGVSPRCIERPLLNFAAFEKHELKLMLQRDLVEINNKLMVRQLQLQKIVDTPPPASIVPLKKKRGRKKKATKKGGNYHKLQISSNLNDYCPFLEYKGYC